MEELLCDILEITTIGENKFFKIYSIEEDKIYSIPTIRLNNYNVIVGEQYFFCKRKRNNSNVYYLDYVCSAKNKDKKITHRYYNCNKIYDFKIIKIKSQLTKKNQTIPVINVVDIDGNIIEILGLKWQKEELWKFETLQCEVEKILENGIPKLINRDYRHPIYKIDQECEFKIIGEKTKVTDKGSFDVFELEGDDGCIHEVTKLASQKIALKKIESIQCKITSITTHLRLLQINVQDPFYVTFDEIVKDKKLELNFFISLFNVADKTAKDLTRFIEQYNSKSALWVITYTNKILPILFKNMLEIPDLKEAKEINKLICIFEEWIIKKGIITSFTEELGEITKTKAKSLLSSANIIDEVLDKIIYNPINILNDNTLFIDSKNIFEKMYYIIYFSKIESLDENLIISRFQEFAVNKIINIDDDLYYLNKIINHIAYYKNVFISEKENEYFSLATPKIGKLHFTNKETKYMNWSFIEMTIAQILSKKEHINILCGKLLKLFTKSTLEIEKKECLLFNAYKCFENYQCVDFKIPFIYKDQLAVNYEVLDNNISCANDDNENWDELEQYFTDSIPFSVRLTKKSKTGYEVNFNNLKGFLPYHLIKDNSLKKYQFEESDFTTNARCLSISRPFNFFIIEQMPGLDNRSCCKNNLMFIKGNIYEAYIKTIIVVR